MTEKKLISKGEVSDNLLTNLENRDVALWVRSLPTALHDRESLVSFLGLPWRLVISEVSDPQVIKGLEDAASFDDPMTRKRGFVQVIDSDPSRIDLPQRSLPIYLLNGRQGPASGSDFENKLRRMTMLEELRRSGAREILLLSDDANVVPPELSDLWSSGFRAYVTFVSDSAHAEKAVDKWLSETPDIAAANLLQLSTTQVITEVVARYSAVYPEDRHVIRARDVHGNMHRVDVTTVDEPERPILDHYSLIQERNLTPLVPQELSEDEFVAFFQNPDTSWRPYAAGLPWRRDAQSKKVLSGLLNKLDVVGAEENCVAYISSESGAGGTTLAHALAWECAREGYPVLLAKPLPFAPDALPVVNFLTRALKEVDRQTSHTAEIDLPSEGGHLATQRKEPSSRRYEVPWVIVFDSLHWQNRDSELLRFRNEIAQSGRPVCLLVVTGTVRGLSFFNTAIFKPIAELNHSLSHAEAHLLGRHLNQFLRAYGKERPDWQWDRFYQDHTVRHLEGVAAFWVTLSFWIQGQYDLSESIQQWIYRSFKASAIDGTLQKAILEIAALSSERIPMPEALLPPARGTWPISHLLEDHRADLAAIGLTRISANGERHWALVHDILGRFLINALFYDSALRQELGFGDAKDAEHLRFLVLSQISQKPILGERAYLSIAEDFATTIFKIDPDHGLGSFAPLWREAIDALDDMPRSVRDTSRVFRHHTAISRRRIAKLDENLYGVKTADKIVLLGEAIEDITYALNFIEYSPGSESNLNLFNSLANAYFDLADAESQNGASPERTSKLRELAADATRKAYGESPTNSFVIETYVRNLLQNAKEPSQQALENCIEALGVVFSALTSGQVVYRKSQLGNLADQALSLLLKQAPSPANDIDPRSAIEVLVKAWKLLTADNDSWSGTTLSDVPAANRAQALDCLSNPAGRGNMQVIRLSYDLTCLNHPHAFKKQLEFVAQLQATDYRMTPQLKLEHAILLFQTSRANEGDKVFRSLRQMWRDSEHFVYVPERLRWLRAADGEALQTVRAVSGSDYATRAMARVQEFGNALVAFRPEEHGIRDLRPGLSFACYVSFGHNGPFLRPVTARPH